MSHRNEVRFIRVDRCTLSQYGEVRPDRITEWLNVSLIQSVGIDPWVKNDDDPDLKYTAICMLGGFKNDTIEVFHTDETPESFLKRVHELWR